MREMRGDAETGVLFVVRVLKALSRLLELSLLTYISHFDCIQEPGLCLLYKQSINEVPVAPFQIP